MIGTNALMVVERLLQQLHLVGPQVPWIAQIEAELAGKGKQMKTNLAKKWSTIIATVLQIFS